jgi:hypothetical protein
MIALGLKSSGNLKIYENFQTFLDTALLRAGYAAL